MTDDLIQILKDMNEHIAQSFRGVFDIMTGLSEVAGRHKRKILELQDRLAKLEGR